VVGVGTTKTGYVIRFKDKRSAKPARTNTEWLEKLGNGTKLVNPRFEIVVHRTPTEDFSLPKNKKQGINRIMEENDLAVKGYQIDDIAWLKKKDKLLGKSASLKIWLKTPEAAEWIINNGLIVGQRYIGSIEPYQIKRKDIANVKALATSRGPAENPRNTHTALENMINETSPRARTQSVLTAMGRTQQETRIVRDTL
jgi:hypothetical protein